MTPASKTKSPVLAGLVSLTRKQLFIPIAALLALIIFNLIADPSFFAIKLGYNSANQPVL